MLNHSRVHENGNLSRKPWSKAQTQSVCYTKPRAVFGPKRLEMHGQAYLPSSIHLVGLAIELGELELGGGGRVSDGDVELEIELVL